MIGSHNCYYVNSLPERNFFKGAPPPPPVYGTVSYPPPGGQGVYMRPETTIISQALMHEVEEN